MVLIIEVSYLVLGLNTETDVVDSTVSKAADKPKNTVRVREDDIEKLRSEVAHNKVCLLKPVLKNLSEGLCQEDLPVLQIIEIIPAEKAFSVRLSDRDFWFQMTLNALLSERVSKKQLSKYDIIRLIEYSGNPGCGNFKLDIMCKPGTIQMKPPSLIGSPVPLNVVAGPSMVSHRTKKIPPKAPRVVALFEDADLDR